jgi:hypothetical protein
MLEWLRAPALYDAILVLLAVEGALLARIARRAPAAPLARSYISFLIAGAGLALALRATAAGWPAWRIGAGLTIALVAHLWHLRTLAR